MTRGSLSHWLRSSPAWPSSKASPGGGATTSSAERAGAALEADVLIIGAGITGCSLAFHLRNLDPHLKVVVVEARGISEGATGRNGGIMWPGLCAPWPVTVQQHGEQGARQLMQFEMRCFQDVLDFITRHELEDELQFSLFPDGGLTLCESKEELDAELADLAMQKQVGLEPLATPLTPDQLTARLGKHHFVGGLCQSKVARVTAVRLAHALLKRAAQVQPEPGGPELVIMQHTRITTLERLPAGGAGHRFRAVCRPEDSGTVVRLDEATLRGAGDGVHDVVVHAARVVHCTNGYNDLLPHLTRLGWLVPVRNQVTVTSPLPPEHPLPRAAFYARNGYVYWSRRHDGRVVIGGFRDVTPHMEWGTRDDSSSGMDPYVSAQLKAYLPSALPHLFPPPGSAGPSLPRAQSSSSPTRRPSQAMLVVAHTAAQDQDQDQEHEAPSRASASAGGGTAAGSGGNWTKSSKVLDTHAGHHATTPPAAPVVVAAGDPGARTTPAAAASAGPSMPLQYELEWAGILGFTKDHWPLWGALPPELASSPPRGAGGGPSYEYVCVGFSGYGMVRAYNCARNLALLLTGSPLEPGFPAKVFSPARVLAAPSSKM